MTLIYQSPRSQWLKVSAAAVRASDPLRADIWHWLALEIERVEAKKGICYSGSVAHNDRE